MAYILLFDKKARNAGTYNSPVVDVPQGVTGVFTLALLDDAAIIDPTLTITWFVRATFDGSNWVDLVGGGWQGGIDEEGNPVGAPNQSWQCASMPLQVQASLTLSKRVSIGLEADIV